ncbi:mannosyltransferase [Flavobacteriales bacterium 34_180_T64]|nr:mannosyltransferase [Flavobacteriales bacterium 34_180_T64]
MILNSTFLKLNKTSILLAIISALFYLSFAYDLARTDYFKLITLYISLFFLFYKLIQINKSNTRLLIYCSFIFRAVFILAIPNLSQDFYRFIWDGRMILEGFNPYLYTPESFISQDLNPVIQAQELYTGMGVLNGSHFTNYPPINQLCFLISSLFMGNTVLGSVIIMRILIIAADFGTLYFGRKLLKLFNLPTHQIFWYILNPFIIIELTGNLHFEGVMIFFLTWGLYLLHTKKWVSAALIFALSVSVKLIPLLFLPLFYQWFVKRNVITNEVKQSISTNEIATSQVLRNDNRDSSLAFRMTKLITFYLIVGITTILLFLPFYSTEFIYNYAETVGLWFQNFEFNASIYYLVRAIGYGITGFNEIAIIGKIIPALVLIFVVIMSLFRKNNTTLKLISGMLIALSFYYFTTTTVHPWYVATLLILSVFTNYKYPLVWSVVIILSYLGYASSGTSENLWIIGLEYLIVYSVFFYEVFLKKETNPIFHH